MNTLIKFLLCTTIFFSITINAQNNQKYSGLWIEKQSVAGNKNLKDSVKTVYFKMGNFKQNLSNSDKSRVIIDNDIRNFAYLNLDQYGRIKTIRNSIAGDRYLSNIDYKKTEDYLYDERDWAEKSKYKTKLKQYYPVMNHSLLLKLNSTEVQKEEVIMGGKIFQELSKDVYIYIYIYDEKGRVKEEQVYWLHRLGETIKDSTHKKEDLYTRKLFTYNAKDQVVNQKIIAGLRAKEMAYTDLGTECGFCNDLQLKYAYDQLGRITQVTMYGCEEIVAKEEYIYHPTKDYVEKVKCYVTGPGEMSNPTKRYIKTYNEQGDLIEKEFIPNSPQQTLTEKIRYYSYEYDSHNNWIKCNMYMEGSKEGEPSLVAERKIEYYN